MCAQNSWTALIVAASGGYADVVQLLLERHPNVNAGDKVIARLRLYWLLSMPYRRISLSMCMSVLSVRPKLELLVRLSCYASVITARVLPFRIVYNYNPFVNHSHSFEYIRFLLLAFFFKHFLVLV